jgi:internalin A
MAHNNKEVEKKIEAARLSGAEELHLMTCGLTEVPESLAQLTQLRRLSLYNNHLRTLPAWLGCLTQLEWLNLAINPLTTLPEWFGHFKQLHTLNLYRNGLIKLPESMGQLTQLRSLLLWSNQLPELPESMGRLTRLEQLNLSNNPLKALPVWLGRLTELRTLSLWGLKLQALPEWLGSLTQLESLDLSFNQLTTLPEWLAQFKQLQTLALNNNPLNPELAAAYKEGGDAVMRYLRAKAGAQVVLNEAKLILVGEGEVGKSCLLGALRDDEWEEGRPTTHGIEIKPVKVKVPETGTEITLNGWDFGGQRVYRPTHQLFFSAPAVYLVVWKPREGPQQGFVKEWIKLVKHREPEAKVLVVATHGGPKERQPDIDRQEVWDLFGRDMVLDFFLVESKPDKKTRKRKGIPELKKAVARVAASLPEVGRTVPKRWEEARQELKATNAAYLPLDEVLKICRDLKMDEEEAKDFVRISHRLGHLIHYAHDPTLRDIVVLKPDWLATAVSFVLDDEETRGNRGLVTFSRLGRLWNHPEREPEFRYPPKLHPVFLRLMERFDLSYRVPGSPLGGESDETSLIAQLVPDIRPDLLPVWFADAAEGDEEQLQICRITEGKSGHTAAAEGLFFQLIVRLHRYSLGRAHYAESVHWQRGLVLEDDYGARALLEHTGNDVRITVRSPYPERFLAALTYEVKWLVENFWQGLRCDVMVPCLNAEPCAGLFEVRKLIENKKRGRPEQPCPVCNEWQSIEVLLHNAPAARPDPLEELLANSAEVVRMLTYVRLQLLEQQVEVIGRFDRLDASSRELVSKVEAAYTGLMRALVDEAKEGPRLFSFAPVEPGFFEKPRWVSAKFRVTLWCEHSRLPLPALNGEGDTRGVYELSVPREWLTKAAPFLKLLAGTLSLVVPVASSATKLMLDDASYKGIEEQLDLGQKSLDAVLKGGEKIGGWTRRGDDAPDLEHGEAQRAQGAVLRQLHVWLKEKDPGFGGLVRVQNKRQEFLWVHPQFEKEY